MFLGFFNEGEESVFFVPLTDAEHTPAILDAQPVLTLLGADGPISGTSSGEPAQFGDINSVGATAPIVVTSTAHGLQTGQAVQLVGTATRDGVYIVTQTGANTFTLNGATNGAAQPAPAGGWQTAGVWKFTIPSAAVSSLGAGSTYTAVVTYSVGSVEKVQMFKFCVQ